MAGCAVSLLCWSSLSSAPRSTGSSNFSSGISVNGRSVSGSTFARRVVGDLSQHERWSVTSRRSIPRLTRPAPAARRSRPVAPRRGPTCASRVSPSTSTPRQTLNFHPDAATLAAGQDVARGRVDRRRQANSAHRARAPRRAALAEMPTEMRNFEIPSQAASLDLVAKLNDTIPLTTASMKTVLQVPPDATTTRSA